MNSALSPLSPPPEDELDVDTTGVVAVVVVVGTGVAGTPGEKGLVLSGSAAATVLVLPAPSAIAGSAPSSAVAQSSAMTRVDRPARTQASSTMLIPGAR